MRYILYLGEVAVIQPNEKAFHFLSYSFTLPAEILLIMYLEQKQNTITIGITDIATVRYVAP